jgi:hypothetical protein
VGLERGPLSLVSTIEENRVSESSRYLNKRMMERGTPNGRWLRHYTTSRKDACLSPDEVIDFFQYNPSGHIRPWDSFSL